MIYRKKGHLRGYATTAKCGCTSIQRVLKAEGFEIMARPLRSNERSILLVVRHPLDRLVSCWKFFTDTYHRTGPTPELTVDKDISLSDYFEWTKEHPNQHWDSQSSQHPLWRQWQVIALEDLDAYWPKVGVGTIGHFRTSNHAHWRTYYDDDLYQKVLIHYLDDYAMWWKASVRYQYKKTYIRHDGKYIRKQTLTKLLKDN